MHSRAVRTDRLRLWLCLRIGIVLIILTAAGWFGNQPVQAAAPVALDIRGADIRDVLSALALKLDMNIIYTGDPVEVVFRADSAEPIEALELLLKSQGLSYVQDGKLLVIGTTDRLSQDFYTQMALTRFNLLYVPAASIEDLAGKLGIPVQVVQLDSNPQVFWAQGIPQALQKLRELIAAVDRPENTQSYAQLEYRSYLFSRITAEKAAELLAGAGVPLRNYATYGNKILFFDPDLFPQWNELRAVLTEIEYTDAREKKLLVIELAHTSPENAVTLLNAAGLEEIKVVPLHFSADFAKYGRTIAVVCSPQMEAPVRETIAAIDIERGELRLPLANAELEDSLEELRDFLVKLSGVSAKNMKIEEVNNRYFLWIEDEPERIAQLRNLVADIYGTYNIDRAFVVEEDEDEG